MSVCTLERINTVCFDVVNADNFDLREIFKFRYDNYDIDNKSELFPEHMIYDELDFAATHFILKDEERVLGCARLLTSNESELEVGKYFDISFLTKNYACCEISRLLLAKGIRNGQYSRRLYEYMHSYAKEQGINFAFIFFREALEPYYRKMGFIIGANSFIYNNKQSLCYGVKHKFGFKQV